MILGLGHDMVDIRRIAQAMDRFGQRFLDRLFTPFEQERCQRRALPEAAYAKRFAAKEACSKALGTGFSQGVWFSDIGVQNDPQTGQPTLHLTGGALIRLQSLTPPDTVPLLHLSLTDDFPYAQATVIFSCTQKEERAERQGEPQI